MKKIGVVNGPNLNLLGVRQPDVYDHQTLLDLERMLLDEAKSLGVHLLMMQSNHEGEIIDFIHRHRLELDGILINPAAFSHYSIAILDALLAFEKPVVEVHISDLTKREDFRQVLMTGQAALKVISGKGFDGYLEGLSFLDTSIDKNKKI